MSRQGIWIKLLSFLVFVLLWYLFSYHVGVLLLPRPEMVLKELARLLCRGGTWSSVGVTLVRGGVGFLAALASGGLLGMYAGVDRRAFEFFRPFVLVMQSCPAVVWIALLLVWCGVGGGVPVITVFVAVFPYMFICVSKGMSGIDGRLLEMSRLYGVSRWGRFCGVVLPGLGGSLRSAALLGTGVSWKVAATAEYLGGASGIGREMHVAFQQLNMCLLFAWTALVVILGLSVEFLARGLLSERPH